MRVLLWAVCFSWDNDLDYTLDFPCTVIWEGAKMSEHLHSEVKQMGVLSGFSKVTEPETVRRAAVSSSTVERTPGGVSLKVTR